jgi:hypothetical protein
MCSCDSQTGYVCQYHKVVVERETITLCQNCGEDIYYGKPTDVALRYFNMDENVGWFHKKSGTATCRIMIAEPWDR